jgi:nicotinamide mononucleotide transporter
VTLTPATVKAVEILAMLFGAAFAVLAARRNRLGWLAGGVGSALLAVLASMRGLPMQGALQIFYVGMSAYGWWSWTRASTLGELPVGTWPLSRHLAAAAALTAISVLNAYLLAGKTGAAWPMLDSLTTWFSLYATWLAARARIEHWLYWIVIDVVLTYLFYVQGLPLIALQFALLTVIAMAGFIAWRRRLQAQAVPA